MDKGLKANNRVLMQLRRITLFWGPVIIWMTVIFLLSTRQRITVSPVYLLNFLFFKTLHVMEYGFLYLLSVRAIGNTWQVSRKALAWKAFVLTILYAISDEWHQTFVTTREGTVRDVIIDGIGVFIIWYFLFTWLPKAPKKLKAWAQNLGLFI